MCRCADYQALLDLDENNEVPSTVGASEGEIRRNPSFLVRQGYSTIGYITIGYSTKVPFVRLPGTGERGCTYFGVLIVCKLVPPPTDTSRATTVILVFQKVPGAVSMSILLPCSMNSMKCAPHDVCADITNYHTIALCCGSACQPMHVAFPTLILYCCTE